MPAAVVRPAAHTCIHTHTRARARAHTYSRRPPTAEAKDAYTHAHHSDMHVMIHSGKPSVLCVFSGASYWPYLLLSRRAALLLSIVFCLNTCDSQSYSLLPSTREKLHLCRSRKLSTRESQDSGPQTSYIITAQHVLNGGSSAGRVSSQKYPWAHRKIPPLTKSAKAPRAPCMSQTSVLAPKQHSLSSIQRMQAASRKQAGTEGQLSHRGESNPVARACACPSITPQVKKTDGALRSPGPASCSL